MNISKIILTLLTIGALVLVPTVATAQTFTFTETDGDWNTPTNWNPTDGPPQAADNAIIPDDTICRVKTENQAAADVDVQSGGTLVIESKSLTISSGTTLTVNGTGKLEINNTGGGAGQLLWLSGNLTLDGTGTIDAGDGVIRNSGSTSGDLNIGTATQAGPTIKGNLTIDPAGNIFNFGGLRVDDSADTMVLGALSYTSTLRFLHGTSELLITAGTMKITRMAFAGPFLCDPGWTGDITVNGATAKLHLTDHDSDIRVINSCMILKGGGTIDFDRTVSISKGFDFTDGTINVAAGELVGFFGVCP